MIYDPKEMMVEFYNLDLDPGKQHHLAQSEPQRVEDLVQRLDASWGRTAQLAPLPSATPKHLDAETVDALRALGYID